MGIPNLPVPPPNPSTQQLAQIVGELSQQLTYLLSGFLSSDNAREFGGWSVGKTELQSKDKTVGMSTNKNGIDPIRFFAGDVIDGTPKFQVTEAGILTAVGMILKNAFAGQKIIMDETGFHTFDEYGIERITIGTTPAKGAKALITRDASGTPQGVYTYDTENVDGADRTGQYITAHSAYLLFSTDGDVRLVNSASQGFRAVSGLPEMSDGFGWYTIAKKSDVDSLAARVSALESAGP